MEIRTLNSDDVECRVAMVKEGTNGKKGGCSLLLYKDARCDMRILDEVFGPMGWKREHKMIGDRLYCCISVWDNVKGQWISKEDVGTESYTEKEKGQASDSFKRAGFNWGIGRELYTAPFIWVQLEDSEIVKRGQSLGVKPKFIVRAIGYNENREINELVISDDKGRIRFEMRNKEPEHTDKDTLEKYVKATKNALKKLFNDDATAAKAYWDEHISQDENDLSKMQYHYKAAASKLKLMEEKRDGAQV